MPWGIVGHERVLAALQSSLRQHTLPHALLLTGPRQTGRRTLALALARAINCAQPADGPEPCGACRACRLTAAGGFPDTHLIELRQGRQKIGLREIQELQAALVRRPSEGRRRVAVIVDAERLSAEAENCLLKTLEEPPPHAVLLLTAEEAEALLPTTVSRCRRVRLRPVDRRAIAQHLVEQLGLDPERAARLADQSAGRPGWAIAAARQPELLARSDTALERLTATLDSGALGRLAVARELAETWSSAPERVREELRAWAFWWRDALLLKLGLSEHLRYPQRRDELEALAQRYQLAELETAVTVLNHALGDLDQNVNARLALDVALLKLPRPPHPSAERGDTSRARPRAATR